MLRSIAKQALLEARPLVHRGMLCQLHSKPPAVASNKVPVTDILVDWKEKLKQADVGDIAFNLKCLVAHVLKREFSTLPQYDELHFTPEQLEEFQRLCEARCARMPLQHILGEWDFMNLNLKMAPTVFIPRPETEEFVRRVVGNYSNTTSTSLPLQMLEVGCGSGAISLAILHELPHVHGTAIERSKAATALACENAQRVGLQSRFTLYNHTMTEDKYLPDELADEKYDLIVSNPPYVKTGEFQYLQPEVLLFENRNALDGGPTGLRIARVVLDLACVHLRSGGKLWLELGNEHPPMIRTVINSKYAQQLRYVAGYEDQYKRERFVEIEKI